MCQIEKQIKTNNKEDYLKNNTEATVEMRRIETDKAAIAHEILTYALKKRKTLPQDGKYFTADLYLKSLLINCVKKGRFFVIWLNYCGSIISITLSFCIIEHDLIVYNYTIIIDAHMLETPCCCCCCSI